MAVSPAKIWSKLVVDQGSNDLTALSASKDGSIYVAGFSNSPVNGQINQGNNDAYLVKYSSEGAILWTRILGTQWEERALGITTSLNNSIYVTGYTGGSLDGQTRLGNQDIFICKFSSDGTKNWTKQIGTSADEWATSITTGLDGAIYITGSGGKFTDDLTDKLWGSFVIKLGVEGNIIWTRTEGIGFNSNALTTGLDGAIYVAGVTERSLEGQLFSGGNDAFITKFLPNGNIGWTRLIGNSSNEFATGVTTGIDGSIYICGYTNGAIDDQSFLGHSFNTFVTKFTLDGTKVWTRILSKGQPSGITVGGDGGLLISGYGVSNSGYAGANLIKCNTNGNVEWSKFLDTTTYGNSARALTTDETGSIYIGGYSNSGAFLAKFLEEPISNYSLNVSSTTVNEGSTVTFTLTTTNVASGTSVPYTLSGISAADVSGGSLSGNTVVNSSGVATISVTLLNDSLTEGTETLTVSVNGALASTLVYDTSLTPTYKLTALTTQVNESVVVSIDPVTLTRTAIQVIDKPGVDDPVNMFAGVTKWYVDPANGRNLPVIGEIYEGDIAFFYIPAVDPEGSTLSFSIQDRGSTGGDDSDASLFTMVAGTNSFKFTTPPDFENPRDKKLLNNQDPNNIISGAADNVYAVEAVASGYGTHYAIIVKNVNEPTDLSNYSTIASFALSTTNVPSGTSVSYVISGVDSNDILSGQLSGTTTVYSGTKVIEVPIAADSKTEGSETLTITINSASASTIINDTSKDIIATPTYRISTSNSSINEGSSTVFTLSTSNLASGSSVPYTISGVSSTDILGGSLSGSITINSTGIGTISVSLLSDSLTEGAEVLTVTAGGAIASTIVNDTSVAATATYNLASASASVNEGSIANFTLTTTNVASGTSVPFTLTGLSNSDVLGGQLSGNAIVNSAGVASISISLINDSINEGNETLTVTAAGKSASILINDTSIGAISTVPSIPYGSGLMYFGSTAADTIIGTSALDYVKQPSVSSANKISKSTDGSWSIQNKSNLITDTITNVERVEFTDISFALDVSGSAGQTAKLLGSVFGPAAVSNTIYAGIGLAYLDNGMSYKDLAKLAADAAGLTTADLLVSALWKNVTGFTATDSNKAPYIKYLNDGMSVGDMVVLAADSSINLQSINLTAIANSGLAYTPFTLTTATPTYSLLSSQSTVNEGSSASFTLTTSNVASGTVLTYSLSGVSTSDLTSGSLNGNVSIGANGLGSITLPISADNLTEGSETLSVSVQSASASVVIIDTSVSANPTYTLTPATSSVNEGQLAQVYLATTNVAAGTALDFSITGISRSDVIENLGRQVIVDAAGRAVIDINVVADSVTEGPETMYITMAKSTAFILINDTSIELVGVPSDGGGGGGGGGAGGGD
jgi:hypothetical protein